MPTARDQPAEQRLARRRLVGVERLRVVTLGELEYLLAGHVAAPERLLVAHLDVLEALSHVPPWFPAGYSPSRAPTDRSTTRSVGRCWRCIYPFGRTGKRMADDLDLDDLDRAERAALKRTRAAATFLDEAFRVPGTNYRVGADPILSIVPVSGDVAGAVLSMYIVGEAARIGVPGKTLAQMVVNISIDTASGSIPVLGTVADAAFKANRRNVELIEEHLASG